MVNVLISCIGDQLNCPPSEPFFKINSITSNNLQQIDSQNGYYESADLTDTIKQDNFFINVSTRIEYYSQNISISSGGKLLAIDCEENNGYQGTKEGIKDITIITLYDYNLKYSANDTITESVLFKAFSGYSIDFNEFMNLSDFVIQNENSISEESFNIKVSENIVNTNQKVSFKIILELTNGDVFETTTNEIVIKE